MTEVKGSKTQQNGKSNSNQKEQQNDDEDEGVVYWDHGDTRARQEKVLFYLFSLFFFSHFNYFFHVYLFC
jgi:hypothetical protein